MEFHHELYLQSMNLADEAVRAHLLTNGPLGRWQTVPGTHTQLSNESFEFREDGTGELHTSSLMHGDEVWRFSWRMFDHGVVECQLVYETLEVDDTGQPEESDWSRLPFVFEQQCTDSGWYWVLKQPNRSGFWDSNFPMVPSVQ
jgi:hypothetical protein